jgi:hypothetical protein
VTRASHPDRMAAAITRMVSGFIGFIGCSNRTDFWWLVS